MVVCKCRKATRHYCFVHTTPVCGDCICSPEHQMCVVRTYADWVIDGDYDWPSRCCSCNASLVGGNDTMVVRLACLHLIHTNCLISHIQSYPTSTLPAGYVCPSCSLPIWSPGSMKDSGSLLQSKLKDILIQHDLERNVLGDQYKESRHPPPAFSSEPLVHVSTSEMKSIEDIPHPAANSSISFEREQYLSKSNLTSDIVEIDAPTAVGVQFVSETEPDYKKSSSPVPGATTRKSAHLIDRQDSEISYYADDEDGTHRKYNRRGPLRHKFMRFLLPFWSRALPTLPVTAPPRSSHADNAENRPRQQRSGRIDPRKILLTVAIMACLATMGILYYRLAQRTILESEQEIQQQ